MHAGGLRNVGKSTLYNTLRIWSEGMLAEAHVQRIRQVKQNEAGMDFALGAKASLTIPKRLTRTPQQDCAADWPSMQSQRRNVF